MRHNPPRNWHKAGTWVRPTLTTIADEFRIRSRPSPGGGKRTWPATRPSFRIAATCHLINVLMLLTGPEHGGKIHIPPPECALFVVLAQAGSTASRRNRCVGDRGSVVQPGRCASDDLARGRSTFMVEMTETAAISCIRRVQSRWSLWMKSVRGTSTSGWIGHRVGGFGSFALEPYGAALFSPHISMNLRNWQIACHG